MGRFLLIISFLFIAHSCFAVKPADTRAARSQVIKKKLFLFSRANTAEETVSADYFEHPTLVQQVLKRTFISSLQLFRGQENKQALSASVRTYVANPRSSYNFIYQCLYPKHAFW